MAERPFWPDGDPLTEPETSGVVFLARSALRSPMPSPLAEETSRERVLAQFQDLLPMPKDLHRDGDPAAWAGRVGRVVRRWLGK